MRSERLIYHRLSHEHYEDYASWYSNPAVAKFITGEPLSTEAIRARFARARQTNTVASEMGWYLCYLKDEGAFVGIAKLIPIEIDGEHSAAEVGYGSLPQFWGQGIATEMLQAILALAKEREVHHLVGIVNEENSASIRVLDKFGFRMDAEEIDGAHRYCLTIP